VFSLFETTERIRAEQALREARDGLGRKVEERTAELQQTNERLREENQERIRTEHSLRLEEARLDALFQLGRLDTASIKEITGFALEQAIRLTDSKIGFLGFLNADESVYTLHAVSKDVMKECNVTGDPLQWHVVDAGIWAEAIRERRTLFVNDYSQAHPGKKGLPAGHPPVERFMVVPILEGGRIVALGGVGNKVSDYEKSDERQVVLLLTGMWGYVRRNRSREELRNAYNQLQKLALELTETENRERQRLAEILHDDIQQILAAAKFHLGIVSARCKDDETSRATAEQVKQLLVEAIGKSRSLSHELGPPGLAHSDLQETFEWLAGQMQAKHGLTVHVDVGDRIVLQSEPLKTLLFKAAQEMLFNVVKHAQVHEARLHLRRWRGNTRLAVSDRGRGFDPRDTGKTTEFGLLSIRDRVNLLGGRMKVRSAKGKGSTFLILVPDTAQKTNTIEHV
jgi:signal transduction histidine kinase